MTTNNNATNERKYVYVVFMGGNLAGIFNTEEKAKGDILFAIQDWCDEEDIEPPTEEEWDEIESDLENYKSCEFNDMPFYYERHRVF